MTSEPTSGKWSVQGTAYKRYMLGVLLVIYAFNGVDRLALGLVLQDIKTELALNDTQLGVLTGIAFALFYSIVGIPIARWADRGNRVTIIAVTTGLWSLAVGLCGFAANFAQMLFMRVCVAVGESGCMPPAHSLIADHFTRAERPKAVSIYLLGGCLSILIGYFLAGWLNEFYGWRVTFMILGLPGVGLGLLAWFTLREPRFMKSAAAAELAGRARVPVPPSEQPSVREVCATLWGNFTFRHLLFCFAVNAFFSGGIAQWKPAFFIRSFGLETGEIGTWFAVIYGIGNLAGTYIGGQWATRKAANNERLQLKAIAVIYAGVTLISVLIYLSPNHYMAFGFMALTAVVAAMIAGPMFACIQTLVPPHMRAMSIAILYLFANLIGMGLGPLAAGVLSDIFRPAFGEESLRYSLLVMCPGYLWGAWHLWRASKTVTRDLQKALERPAAPLPRGGEMVST